MSGDSCKCGNEQGHRYVSTSSVTVSSCERGNEQGHGYVSPSSVTVSSRLVSPFCFCCPASQQYQAITTNRPFAAAHQYNRRGLGKGPASCRATQRYSQTTATRLDRTKLTQASILTSYQIGVGSYKAFTLSDIMAIDSDIDCTTYITNSVALVRERIIPTERPPLVGEVSANFCG
jgi:hypothetical protein